MNSKKVQEDLYRIRNFYQKVGSLDPLMMEADNEEVQMVAKYLKVMKVAPYELQTLFRYAYIDGLRDWDLEVKYMMPEKWMKKLHSRLRGYLIKALKGKGGEDIWH